MEKYYDVHCHVFNKDVIIRRLVNVVQFLLEVAESKESITSNHKLKNMVASLDVVTNDSSEDIFNVLNDAYKGKFIVTPLMLDLTYADDNDGDKGEDRRYRRRIRVIFKLIKMLLPFVKRKIKTKEGKDAIDQLKIQLKEFYKKFEVRTDKEVEIFEDANYIRQMADLKYLARNYSNVKPFYSVDPRQQYKSENNIIDTLKEIFLVDDPDFYGIKLYAPVGFSPTDPVLMGTKTNQGVYDFCIEHNIPITAHCSNAGFACFSTNLEVKGDLNIHDNIIKWPSNKYKFHYKFFSRKASKAISERASILNHPRLWEKVLQKHPTLTLNLAHFGGSGQILDYVLYSINETKIDADDFEESISHLPDDMQKTIESAYHKRYSKMVINEDLDLDERQNVWNAMYHANLIDNWAKAIFDIVRNPKYPNAYTDLSCFSEGEMLGEVFSIKKNLEIFKTQMYDKFSNYEKSKILYGSDYFLIQLFGSQIKQYISDFEEVFGEEFKQIASFNPERFLFVK